MPFSTKPFAVYSRTSFDINSFICDVKEVVEKYLLTNEVISSKHIEDREQPNTVKISVLSGSCCASLWTMENQNTIHKL